ncbi:helix-turn-helix domain-containing protein [Priestia aryabhattai]
MRSEKVENITREAHKNMNSIVVGTAEYLKEASVAHRLDDLLKERGVTQKELAAMTGMRVATISELVNGKGISFNYVQTLALIVALRLTSFNELFELRLPKEMQEQFEKESAQWIRTKEMPDSVFKLYFNNTIRAVTERKKKTPNK